MAATQSISPYGEKPQSDRTTGYVLLGVLVAALAFAAYTVITQDDQQMPFNPRWNGAVKMVSKADVSEFSFARVSFGMTPTMVGRIHKGAHTRIRGTGALIGDFRHDDADIRVWHLGPRHKQALWRIRATQTFEVSREAEVLRALALRFGKPIDGTCDISQVRGNSDCEFSWRAQNIDIRAKTDRRLGTAKARTFQLMLTAEDIRLSRHVNR